MTALREVGKTWDGDAYDTLRFNNLLEVNLLQKDLYFSLVFVLGVSLTSWKGVS